MELNATFFALAIPAVIFAGISKGGFGSGAAFAAAPFLALILEPAQAIGLMLPLLMVMDVSALRPYWGKWDRSVAWRMIVGGLPGVAAGTLLFRVADGDLLRLLIGGIALGFVAFQLLRARGFLQLRQRHSGHGAGFVWGAVAGFTSFVTHAGGPPAAVYMLSRGMDKTTYQATSVIVFTAINVFKLFPYIALGLFTQQSLMVNLMLAPVAFLGVVLGVVLHRLVPERLFFALTYLFLTITGAKLIFDALA